MRLLGAAAASAAVECTGPGSTPGVAGAWGSTGGREPVSAPWGVAAGEAAETSSVGENGEPVRVVVPSKAPSREVVRASSWESEGEWSPPNSSKMEPARTWRVSFQLATVLATAARSSAIL